MIQSLGIVLDGDISPKTHMQETDAPIAVQHLFRAQQLFIFFLSRARFFLILSACRLATFCFSDSPSRARSCLSFLSSSLASFCFSDSPPRARFCLSF